MNRLRKKHIYQGYCILLTPEESDEFRAYHSDENPYWLPEHRDIPESHPYFCGPFSLENANYYHIHCSREEWLSFNFAIDNHWSSVYSPIYYSLSSVMNQRAFPTCTNNDLEPEMFDNYYIWYFQPSAFF